MNRVRAIIFLFILNRFSFVTNVTNFFIHFLSKFVLENIILTRYWFSLICACDLSNFQTLLRKRPMDSWKTCKTFPKIFSDEHLKNAFLVLHFNPCILLRSYTLKLKAHTYLTHEMPELPSYRDQLIDLWLVSTWGQNWHLMG